MLINVARDTLRFIPPAQTPAPAAACCLLSDVGTGDGIRKLAVTETRHMWALAMSSTGRWAVTSSTVDKPVVMLWDSDTGKQVRRLDGAYGQVNGLAISPDDKLVAGVSDSGSIDERGVWLWELTTGKQIKRLPYSSKCVAFSPDGRHAAAGGVDGAIRLFDTKDWQVVQRLTGHPAVVEALAFSPNGRLLASGGSRDQVRDPSNLDGSVRLWDVATGKQLHVLEGHQWAVASVDFSPDGRYLLSGGGFPDGKIRLWRLPNQ